MARPTVASHRRHRRMITALWLVALFVVTAVLIYYEMTAVLYILATLGVTALLCVVAMADLGRDEKPGLDAQRVNDSAAIGSGISS